MGAFLVPLVIAFIAMPGWPSPRVDKAPHIVLPHGSVGHPPHDFEPSFELTITRDGRFWLNDGSELAAADVKRAVRMEFGYVSIRADQDVPFGVVRTAMREIGRGGHKGLALVVNYRR